MSAHDREHYRFGKVLQRAQHDVNRKRGAIRTPGDEVEAGTHRPHARLGSEFGAMGDVTFPEVLRYQRLYRRRDEGCRLLTEQSARLTIGILYDALPIDREDRIRQQLEQL